MCMKNLITLTILAIFANVATATSGVNVGFKSKLLEQGVVTGSNYVVAGAEVEVSSFGLGVTTYSAIEDFTSKSGLVNSGLFKRVDVTASYKFTSALADLTLGVTYRNAGKNASIANIRDNVLPSVALDGKAFKVLPWNVTLTNDLKNRTNNIEGNFSAPFGTNTVKLVPSIGVGFNDPGAVTIAALRGVKKYYNGSLGLTYTTTFGALGADIFVHRPDLTNNYGQVTGYSAGYSYKF